MASKIRDFENAASFLLDQVVDTLNAALPDETPDRRLRDSLNVVSPNLVTPLCSFFPCGLDKSDPSGIFQHFSPERTLEMLEASSLSMSLYAGNGMFISVAW